MQWIDKYKPTRMKDVAGNRDAKIILKNFLESWVMNRPIKKVMFMYGHSGNGKNTIIDAFCTEHQFELVIFNPSHYTDQDKMMKIIISTSRSGTLEGSHGIKLIVLDGIEIIDKAIKNKYWSDMKNTKQPMILIGDSSEGLDYKIKRSCLEVLTGKPSESVMLKLLKKIVMKEKLEVSDGDLLLICKSALSVRSSISNLEYLSLGSITKDDLVEKLQLLNKNEQVKLLLSGKDVHLTMTPDELQTWILDNGGSPDIVAMSDVFHARTIKTNNYGYWKYSYNLLIQCRSNNDINYPRLYLQMFKARMHLNKKLAIKNKTKKVKKEKTKQAKKANDVGGLEDFF